MLVRKVLLTVVLVGMSMMASQSWATSEGGAKAKYTRRLNEEETRQIRTALQMLSDTGFKTIYKDLNEMLARDEILVVTEWQEGGDDRACEIQYIRWPLPGRAEIHLGKQLFIDNKAYEEKLALLKRTRLRTNETMEHRDQRLRNVVETWQFGDQLALPDALVHEATHLINRHLQIWWTNKLSELKAVDSEIKFYKRLSTTYRLTPAQTSVVNSGLDQLIQARSEIDEKNFWSYALGK